MFGIHFPFLSGEPPRLTILKVNLKPIISNKRIFSSQELLFNVNLILSEFTSLFYCIFLAHRNRQILLVI